MGNPQYIQNAVDTKAFKDELEYWGWCFTPSLDGTIFFTFND